ncbi:MarR family transcriptional regulator [Streptomyces sp. NPDC094143]|uniref:MarR family transcriptional regulator n=1 Tax=Streptomyces sp. NPDC094143 TaxID=3155310 RepID=UPI00332085D4
MTTTAPSLDPRVIALGHYAGRAILETLPARHGVTFQQSVTLRLAAAADGPLGRDRLADGVTGALKTGPAPAHGVIDELIAARLPAPEGTSDGRITEAGREPYARTSGETAPITARVHHGIPEEEPAVAGRVLSLITERADAEPAAPSGSSGQ